MATAIEFNNVSKLYRLGLVSMVLAIRRTFWKQERLISVG